jgi:hypothetical protein
MLRLLWVLLGPALVMMSAGGAPDQWSTENAVAISSADLWRDNLPYAVAALVVILFQGFFISRLLFELRRRQSAEHRNRRQLTAMAHLDRRHAMGQLTTASIARSIAEAHSGQIAAENRLEGGAAVQITVPLRRA